MTFNIAMSPSTFKCWMWHCYVECDMWHFKMWHSTFECHIQHQHLNVECDIRILNVNVTFQKCNIPNLNVKFTARCKVSSMMLVLKITLKYLNVGQISPEIGLDLGVLVLVLVLVLALLFLLSSLGLRLGLGLALCLCL